LSILQVNSCSIDQESGEIWAVQANLQQISFESDSLLNGGLHNAASFLSLLGLCLPLLILSYRPLRCTSGTGKPSFFSTCTISSQTSQNRSVFFLLCSR